MNICTVLSGHDVEDVQERAVELECAHLSAQFAEQPLDEDLTIELSKPRGF